ncbi:hypothetical protein GGS20DRAFT_103797 [Poronia punctata]|nr:hypothetical protein GGS20DRAFT_103797 [Poronia punctata]
MGLDCRDRFYISNGEREMCCPRDWDCAFVSSQACWFSEPIEDCGLECCPMGMGYECTVSIADSGGNPICFKRVDHSAISSPSTSTQTTPTTTSASSSTSTNTETGSGNTSTSTLVPTTAQQPEDTQAPTTTPQPETQPVLSTPAIIGIAVGGFLLIVLIIAALLYLLHRRRKQRQEYQETKINSESSTPTTTTGNKQQGGGINAIAELPAGNVLYELGNTEVPGSQVQPKTPRYELY